MTNPTTERLSFDGIEYLLRIPKDAQSRQNKLRVLASIHGSNGSATNYLKIVTDKNDDDQRSLIVVAPQFPEKKSAPNSSTNGMNFDFPESDSYHWLHTLLHCHLPYVLAKRGLTVYTDKGFVS